MNKEFLSGVWTYRSFLNKEEEVDDFNAIRFGQCEMTFEKMGRGPEQLRGQLAFRSDPVQQDDPRLTLLGSIQAGTPDLVRFEGRGVPGTAADGWIYNYIAYFVPFWPDGVHQKAALVGSVIRSVPHGDGAGGTRPAGVVGSFVAVKRSFLEPKLVIPLPNEVRMHLASRAHRLHHAVWHGARNGWNELDKTQREAITALGWSPKRESTRGGVPQTTNGSGEDFLFMHRQMIAMVAEITAEAGASPITGWRQIPAPGPVMVEPNYAAHQSKAFPGNSDGFAVPNAWLDPDDEVTNRRLGSLKSDEFYWSRMRSWEREFRNPEFLRTLKLGELGSMLEYTVHNDMHMRWASVARDPATGEELPAGRDSADISTKWDDPDYDFLGEFYSSHVNPVFWRLHGWIDDRIDDWFEAHDQQQAGSIERTEYGGVDWFKKGKWVQVDAPWSGPNGDKGHPTLDVPTLEKVNEVLFGPSPAAIGQMAALTLRPIGAASHKRKATWFLNP